MRVSANDSRSFQLAGSGLLDQGAAPHHAAWAWAGEHPVAARAQGRLPSGPGSRRPALPDEQHQGAPAQAPWVLHTAAAARQAPALRSRASAYSHSPSPPRCRPARRAWRNAEGRSTCNGVRDCRGGSSRRRPAAAALAARRAVTWPARCWWWRQPRQQEAGCAPGTTARRPAPVRPSLLPSPLAPTCRAARPPCSRARCIHLYGVAAAVCRQTPVDGGRGWPEVSQGVSIPELAAVLGPVASQLPGVM